MDSILENIITNANSIQESEDDTEEITDLAARAGGHDMGKPY